MAATGQGQAGGGDAAAQGNGEAQAAQESGGSEAQLAQQLSELASSQQDLQQWLRSEPWQQQETPQEEAQTQEEPLDLSWLDPADPGYDPEQIAQRLGGLIEQAADRRAQEMRQSDIDPLKNELADMRRQSEAERLVGEFPALGETETANEVVQVARQIAEANNRPELANEPWFWRLTYMAGTAAEAANEEGSESPRAAHLEGGGGAAPAAGQVDYAAQIIDGGGEHLGRRALPF